MSHIRAAAFIILLLFATPATLFAEDPSSLNNADSCDIAVTPAATLLLPYFEVDTAAAVGTGATTLFTITNTSRYPQIAHVTIWTDWAYPIVDFNVLLTGYDVHGINLFDVIVYGILTPSSAAGAIPFNHATNPNFATGELSVQTTCAGLRRLLPPDLIPAVRSALTTGTGYKNGSLNCTGPVGANHGAIAKGYVTIDVVSYCSSRLPTDPGGTYFYGTAAPILFDNVLIGDYQQLGPTPAVSGASRTFDAYGGPMVHIRAVPEGGPSGASGGQVVQTTLPYTFYDRYTPSGVRTADRRQPLPSMWAARYLECCFGWSTDLKIWREGVTTGLPTCSTSGKVQSNSTISINSLITFDEHENARGLGSGYLTNLMFYPSYVSLPAASRTATTSSIFPYRTNSYDVGGWMFLNLSSGSQHVATSGLVFDETLSAQRAGFGPNAPGTGGSRTTTQSWVSASMSGPIGANRLSLDFTAAWLGNGCTPANAYGAQMSNQRTGALVCPANTASSNCGTGTKPPAVNP